MVISSYESNNTSISKLWVHDTAPTPFHMMVLFVRTIPLDFPICHPLLLICCQVSLSFPHAMPCQSPFP
jgi:hypothetical protein